MNHIGEARATFEWFFDEIKTYKFLDFKSQLKINLSSVGKIYLICGVLGNAKTCLYGNKVADFFEINPITVIFCYCPDMKNHRTSDKHPGFQQRYKMIHR